MNNHKYAFAVIGYNNEIGMRRLLKSLDNVIVPHNDSLTLIFCLDKSDNEMINKIAQEYTWNNGEKIIYQHKKRVGLRDNVLSCGNMMNAYNLDAIAVFEDDIYISPVTYKYMVAAIDYYKEDDNIAGISLYKHEININAKHPFYDFNDGGDTFFIQYAMSWGQIWMRESWNRFYQWYEDKKYELLDFEYVPQNILSWKKSWLKYHIMYCIAENKYFVYPRISLTTDFADPGIHNKQINTAMQVPMIWGEKKWKFNSLDSTCSKYDSFFENITLKTFLKLENLEIDLYGVKKIKHSTKFALTRKKLPYKMIKSWGLRLRPIEANVFMNIPGKEIYLYDLSIKENIIKNNQMSYIEYDLKGQNLVCVSIICFIVRDFFERIKNKIKVFLDNRILD